MGVETHTEKRPLLSATAWGYMRNELLIFNWALLEVALLTPLSLTVMGWARYWPAGQVAVWLLLTMLLSFNLARLLDQLELPPSQQQTLTAIAMLLAVLFTLRNLFYAPPSLLDFHWLAQFYDQMKHPESPAVARMVIALVLVVFTWWRGLRLGSRAPDIKTIGLRLRLGGLIFAPILIWLAYGRSTWDITPFLLLFFVGALTAVSLIRADQIEQEQSGLSAPVSVTWFLTILAVTTGTTTSAGILALLISGSNPSGIYGWLNPLWLALRFAGSVILALSIYLAEPIFALFNGLMGWIIPLLSRFLLSLSQAMQQIPLPNLTPDPTSEITNPEQTLSHYGAVDWRSITLLLLIAFVLLVALAIRRQARFRAMALRPVGSAYRAQPSKSANNPLNRLLESLGFLRQWRTAASIRRIYQQMCLLGGEMGYPRAENETPYEYVETLTAVWPAHRQETELITQAFVQIRYGEYPETAEALQAIQNAWTRLEEAAPTTAVAPSTQGPSA